MRGTESEGDGAGIVAPHGIPFDLLDRCLIVRTMPYDKPEIREVIRIRVTIEKLSLTDEALEKLTDLGKETSLRYALQILAPASVLANVGGHAAVNVDDIDQAKTLFIDARSSARNLSTGVMTSAPAAMDVN